MHLFKNTEGEKKPNKQLLWVEKHLEHEDALERWRKNANPPDEDGDGPMTDEFDRLVAAALKWTLPEPEFKVKTVNNPDIMQPVDVTD